MPNRKPTKLHRTHLEEPMDDELDLAAPPIEPDDGIVLPNIPMDPEHDRVVDPED